jgi:hypothetical protein
MSKTMRRRLRATAVAAVAAAGLVVTATAGGAAAGARVTPAAAAKDKPFTQAITGAQISGNGSTLVSVWSVKSSVEGDGAGVVTITLNGSEATGTGTEYWASGAAKFTETFTLGAPAADGTIPYTGSGKCAGGTGVHKKEKCSFTFDGSLNPTTNVFTSNVTGTLNR